MPIISRYISFICLALIITCSAPKLLAQKIKIDSLIKRIHQGREDTLQVKALNQLAYALKSNNADTGIILANEGLRLAKNYVGKKEKACQHEVWGRAIG